ncbi:hypothetical protein BDZ94DRAFT_1301486 [Collybia nuda]|uniref:Uncharacterized protein n=1 Tax=Collybia nuda TaxID=64659 RepID=A0A9P5XUW9_9AGAR|nr:hypothetical protein BDZ94DRAFT_1301486 [Collybia nuda]
MFLHLFPLDPYTLSQPSQSRESALLSRMGNTMVDTLEVTISFTLFYGFFILLFFQSTMTFLQRGLTKWNQRLMFSATLFSFVLATIVEAMLIMQLSIFVHVIFFSSEDIPLANRRLLGNARLNLSLILDFWASTLQIIVSDGVVVWRAFILLQHRKKITMLPILLLLGSTVMYLIYLIHSSISLDVSTSISIFVAATGLSLGTNIISTSLISYVYWIHRKDMKVFLHRRKRRQSQGEWVLAILIESGVVFCLFQAIFLAIEFFQVHTLQDLCLQQLFTTLFRGYVAIYPTLVIVLVNSRQTFDQVYLMETLPPNTMGPSDAAISQPMLFAPPSDMSVKHSSSR